MTTLNRIRSKIQELYEKNPNIHINVSITKPKINLKNKPVVIKGVYPHIFQIEERNSEAVKTRTLQYTDVLLHHIEIVELGEY